MFLSGEGGNMGNRISPSEKARETRRRNSDLRKAKERERVQIRKRMVDTCVGVLDSPVSTMEQRMKAVEILHDLSKGR